MALSVCTDDGALVARHFEKLTLLHFLKCASSAPMGLPPVTRRTLYCQLGTLWMSPPCISNLICLDGRLAAHPQDWQCCLACGEISPVALQERRCMMQADSSASR